jgi:hypothetical protein
MKIAFVNSLSDRDFWYNLQKVHNFYTLFQKIYTFVYFKNISKSERTALNVSKYMGQNAKHFFKTPNIF